MKKRFLIGFIIGLVLCLSGCQKTVTVNFIKDYGSYISAVKNNTSDGSTTHYTVYPSQKVLTVSHFPKYLGIGDFKPDKETTVENVTVGEITKENGQIKSFVVNDTKYVLGW